MSAREYLPAGALCGVHSQVRAVAICARCGKFLCANCLNLSTGTELCEPCVLMGAGGGGSATWLAVTAVVLGFLGTALFPFGVAAISVGMAALARDTRSARKGTLVLVAVAVALSMIGFGLTAVLVVRHAR